MARNTFYVDRRSLKEELEALSDADLESRLQENWEFLYGEGRSRHALPDDPPGEAGEGRMSEDMIQDDAQLEHITVEARAVERIGAEIRAQRAATAKDPATAAPQVEELEPGP